MQQVIFIFIGLLCLAATVAFILRPLLKVDHDKNRDLEKQREADNVKHLQKQLADLERRLEHQEITQAEFDQFKLDSERRLLQSTNPTKKTSKNDTPIALITVICSGVPIFSILIYLLLGSPNLLDPNSANQQQLVRNAPQTVEGAFAEINARIQRDPNDMDAVFALGRLYYANEQYIEARDTFARVFQQEPNRPDLLIAYAEAMARTQNNFFSGTPEQLIERAIQLDPNNKKANWLLGIAAFQQDRTSDALNIWQTQLKRTDNTAREEQMLRQMITEAGGQVEAIKMNEDDAHLTVSASIDETLAGQYAPQDSVFIYARAANGPPMPLAIFRTTADKLPMTLTLTDADAMMPDMALSNFADVVVIARISKSGDAITQSGDLQGQSDVIKNNQQIAVTINSVVP